MGLLMAFVAIVGITSDESNAVDVSSYSDINQALAYSNEAVLQNDIILENGQIITVPEEASSTLDLNGHTISVTEDFIGWAIVNNGTLTITGNGTVDVSNSFD